MRTAGGNYYEEQLDLNNYDLRKSWENPEELVGKNGKFENISNEYNVNGTIIQDSLKNCNTFNKYFIEIGPKLESEIRPLTSPMSYITELAQWGERSLSERTARFDSRSGLTRHIQCSADKNVHIRCTTFVIILSIYVFK